MNRFKLVKRSAIGTDVREFPYLEAARAAMYDLVTLLGERGYRVHQYTGDLLSVEHPVQGRLGFMIEKN